MSLILGELGAYEREAILGYLASASVAIENAEVADVAGEGGADCVAVDVAFPEEFFDVLAELAEGHRREEVAGRDESDFDDGRTARSHSWLCSVIRKFYDYRWSQFHLEFTTPSHHVASGRADGDVGTHFFYFMGNAVGMGELVRRYALDVLSAVRRYRGEDLAVQLFGVLLHSRAYDTEDVRAVLSWRAALAPFRIVLREGGVSRDHVRLRDVPYLLRLCLLPASHGGVGIKGQVGSALIPPVRCPGAWHRSRAALATWCDASGRVPAVVGDPKFYIPPFRRDHPYVGRRKVSAAEEARFGAFSADVLVPISQLLVIMLLNLKEERAAPLA